LYHVAARSSEIEFDAAIRYNSRILLLPPQSNKTARFAKRVFFITRTPCRLLAGLPRICTSAREPSAAHARAHGALRHHGYTGYMTSDRINLDARQSDDRRAGAINFTFQFHADTRARMIAAIRRPFVRALYHNNNNDDDDDNVTGRGVK
jgi:hypothetical protein